MKNHKIGIIIFLCFLSILGAKSQNVKDVTSGVKDGKVIIHYTLDAKFYNEFNVSLYVSSDNGQTFEGPLKEVSGDIGEVTAKGAKTVVWDAMKEMPFVSETFVFDVRAAFVRDKPKQSFFLMYVGNSLTYFGLRGGMLGRVGFYVELRGNLMALNTGKYNYKDGIVDYNEPGYYNFTGSNGYSALSALAGINYQPVKNLFLYLGAGYGKEDYLMKIDEYSYDGDVKTGSDYVKYDGYCNSGVEIDLGLMYRIKWLLLSAGGTTINFKTFNWTGGIGVSF